MSTTSEGKANINHSLVKILDLREGKEESSEETTGFKSSVCEEFDDCPRAEKFVELLCFRHFERFFRFDQSNRENKANSRIGMKKAISDGVNVSVVLDMVCGNTSKQS